MFSANTEALLYKFLFFIIGGTFFALICWVSAVTDITRLKPRLSKIGVVGLIVCAVLLVATCIVPALAVHNKVFFHELSDAFLIDAMISFFRQAFGG